MPLFKVSLESQVPVSAIVVSQATTEQEALAEVRFLQSRARVNWSRGNTRLGAIEAPYEIWAHPRPGGGWNVSLFATIPISHLQSFIASDEESVTEDVQIKQSSGLIPWKYRGVPIGEYKEPIPTFWVNQMPDAATTTTLTMSATTVYPGQNVTMSVVVTGSETAVGNVSIRDVTPGGLGNITLAPLDPDPITPGISRTTTSILVPEGTYSIVAAYLGQDGYQPSSSAPQTLTVSRVATTTTVLAPDPPIFSGQNIQLRVTVDQGSSTAPAPSGTITLFKDGLVQFTTGLDSGGQGIFDLGVLPPGTYQYQVQFDGDSVHAVSIGDSPEFEVGLATTRTTLRVMDPSAEFDLDYSVYSQPIRIRAVVETLVPFLPQVPSGTVTFYKDSAVYMTGTLTFYNSATAIAEFTVDDLPANLVTLMASYPGDSTFSASDSDQKFFGIQKATPIVNAVDLTPTTVIGESAHYRATVGVQPPATKTPFDVYGTSGQVQFGDFGFDYVNFDGFGIADRFAAFTQPGGVQTSVVFQETTEYQSAQTFLFHQVMPNEVTGTMTFNPDPVPANADFVIHANVFAAAPGSALADGGRIDFTTNVSPFGEIYLGGVIAVGGQGEISITNPAQFSGTYTVVVSYTGDSNINPGSFSGTVFAFGSIA